VNYTRHIAAVVVWVILAGWGVLQAGENSGLEKSVVLLKSVCQDFDYDAPWRQGKIIEGIGSGFVIEGKRILTNAHNVSNNKYLEVRKEDVAKLYPAKVAFIGHDCDLAIITVEDEGFFDDTTALKLGELPKVNTTVSTYGFPIGGRHISVTEGVVSRIEIDNYSHSGADAHLAIQTDAAINPGNSGGPVMQDGKVVGVAFQGIRRAENIGYLIPTTVIRHFLADINDGKYDGFGSLGISIYPGLHSESYREYLKVPSGEDGVVVVGTLLNSSAESVLQRGDVITRIDDYDIDNDDRVEIYGLRLNSSEVIETKQIGETVKLAFYRDGSLKETTVAIGLNRPVLDWAREYDRLPRYVCFAGMVFVPLTRNFLETWGNDWYTDIPHYLRYLFENSMELNTDRQLKEYVIVAEVLSDEVNSYCRSIKNEVVKSINGVTINCLDDVYEAFKKPAGDFDLIETISDNEIRPVDAEKARARNQLILDKYDIPDEARLEK
jgi:S1-C subfamily serine protease